MSTPEERTNQRYQDAIDHAMSLNGYGFEIALAALKNGCHARRLGWNGKGMHVEMQTPDEHSKMTEPYLFLVIPMWESRSFGGKVVRGLGERRIPWIASQADLLSDDWQYMVPDSSTRGYTVDPESLMRDLVLASNDDKPYVVGGVSLRPDDCHCPPEGYNLNCPHAEAHQAAADAINEAMRTRMDP